MLMQIYKDANGPMYVKIRYKNVKKNVKQV